MEMCMCQEFQINMTLAVSIFIRNIGRTILREAFIKKSVKFVTLGSDPSPISRKCNEKPIHFFSIIFFPLKLPQK